MPPLLGAVFHRGWGGTRYAALVGSTVLVRSGEEFLSTAPEASPRPGRQSLRRASRHRSPRTLPGELSIDTAVQSPIFGSALHGPQERRQSRSGRWSVPSAAVETGQRIPACCYGLSTIEYRAWPRSPGWEEPTSRQGELSLLTDRPDTPDSYKRQTLPRRPTQPAAFRDIVARITAGSLRTDGKEEHRGGRAGRGKGAVQRSKHICSHKPTACWAGESGRSHRATGGLRDESGH
jgi:hypothetical protein